MKKKCILILCVVLLALTSVLTSCNGKDNPEKKDENQVDEAPGTPPDALFSNLWASADGNSSYILSFDGDKASLTLFLKDILTIKEEGEYSATDETLKIGSYAEFTYTLQEGQLTLRREGRLFRLNAATEETFKNCANRVTLLTNKWEGEGISLEFVEGKSIAINLNDTEMSGGFKMTDDVIEIDAELANYALNKSAQCSGTENATHQAKNAVDGDVATRWSSLYSDPQWFIVDLGEVKSVGMVVINWEVAASKEYEILVSLDGLEYELMYSENNGARDPGVISMPFEEIVKARYVKFNGISRATEYGHSFWEFQVFAKQTPTADIPYTFDGENLTVDIDGVVYSLKIAA